MPSLKKWMLKIVQSCCLTPSPEIYLSVQPEGRMRVKVSIILTTLAVEGDKLALSYISNQVGAALTSARFFLEIKEVSRLMKDPPESFSIDKVLPNAPHGSSTFVEVGEMTPENGMFIYSSD